MLFPGATYSLLLLICHVHFSFWHFFGVVPACRLAFDRSHSIHAFILLVACYLALLGLAARLAWIRMVRFRRFSESGVFRSYLGSRPMRNADNGQLARDQ